MTPPTAKEYLGDNPTIKANLMDKYNTHSDVVMKSIDSLIKAVSGGRINLPKNNLRYVGSGIYSSEIYAAVDICASLEREIGMTKAAKAVENIAKVIVSEGKSLSRETALEILSRLGYQN